MPKSRHRPGCAKGFRPLLALRFGRRRHHAIAKPVQAPRRQADLNHPGVAEDRGAASQGRNPRRNRLWVKTNQVAVIQISRGMNGPADDLPLVLRVGVVPNLGVNDVKTAFLDGPTGMNQAGTVDALTVLRIHVPLP